MPATTKTELLELTVKEFEKLTKLIDGLERDFALEKRDEDTSIKDVIGHRAHWIELFLGWYADGLAGKKVHFPAEGYKWNDLKRYNAELRAQQAELGWKEAVELLCLNHDRLVAFIEQCSQEALYGGPMKGGNNAWTTGRWAEAAGPSHYRSAGKFIRSVLRQSKAWRRYIGWRKNADTPWVYSNSIEVMRASKNGKMPSEFAREITNLYGIITPLTSR